VRAADVRLSIRVSVIGMGRGTVVGVSDTRGAAHVRFDMSNALIWVEFGALRQIEELAS
jgi:uncharacterized protein YbaA (DUF1428 family)